MTSGEIPVVINAPEVPKPVEPGYRSTEFWMSMMALIGGVVLLLNGKDEAGMALSAFAVGGYNVSRGLAKR